MHLCVCVDLCVCVCLCVCERERERGRDNLQGLDGAQRCKQAFADGLELVVIERKQIKALQVFEGVHPQTVDFVGVEQPGWAKRGFSLQTTINSELCGVWIRYINGPYNPICHHTLSSLQSWLMKCQSTAWTHVIYCVFLHLTGIFI